MLDRRSEVECLLTESAAALRVPVMFRLSTPVALRSPDEQAEPNESAEQANDPGEENDNRHVHIMAGTQVF